MTAILLAATASMGAISGLIEGNPVQLLT